MADVEVVIKIPEEQYNLILKTDAGALSVFVSKEGMMYAIKNGTPLPEHHRRLVEDCFSDVDSNDNWHTVFNDDAGCYENVVLLDDIKSAPTIIPAMAKTLFDKMEEEFGKDWDAPKQTTTTEKSCATCGQPRDCGGRCILFKEGKCVEVHEKWTPVTKEGT